MVWAVHVIPSGDVAAITLGPALTATNTPFPYVTDAHCSVLGRVRAVHVIPSGDVAAIAVFSATVTNNPFPYVTEYQYTEPGRVV
jgi:hypothetical protein